MCAGWTSGALAGHLGHLSDIRDIRDIWDIRDIRDSGALAKLKIQTHWLPIQELKTAKELDLSRKGLGVLDAIIVSGCIRSDFKDNHDTH